VGCEGEVERPKRSTGKRSMRALEDLDGSEAEIVMLCIEL